MAEPCEEAVELAAVITNYIAYGIKATCEFGPTGERSRASEKLAQKIQAVIDKGKEARDEH